VIFLHGFASSRNSTKASLFNESLIHWNIRLRTPDLNVPDFSHLTLSAMIQRLSQEVKQCPPGAIFIIGSSLGALVALHFADKYRNTIASRIERMLFLAPSFDFVENRIRDENFGKEKFEEWEKTGWHTFYHYKFEKEFKVHYALIEDIRSYDSYQIQIDIPILIFHGDRDDVVDYQQSIKFGEDRANVSIQLIKNANHNLSNHFHRIWPAAVKFFNLCNEYPRELALTIESYDLANHDDISRFLLFQDRFLDILELAYGTKHFGRAGHLKRIFGEMHTVFIVFQDCVDNEHIVGCSYIRPDGKRSATAVIPECQGRGIARQLICYSKKAFPNQFTEINPLNMKMKHLLTSCGFTLVNSRQTIKKYLGKDADLVKSFSKKNGELIYSRQSNIRPDVVREFVMFEYHSHQY